MNTWDVRVAFVKGLAADGNIDAFNNADNFDKWLAEEKRKAIEDADATCTCKDDKPQEVSQGATISHNTKGLGVVVGMSGYAALVEWFQGGPSTWEKTFNLRRV